MTVNPKAAAWDLVGGDFWSKGRQTARPSAAELELYLGGIRRSDRVVVVGASTKELIGRLYGATEELVVVDFSAQMCRDLLLEVPGVRTVVADITQPVPTTLEGSFDWLIADRLINRFDEDEALAAVGVMASLLRDTGRIRTAVKIGLYPMDSVMLSHANAAFKQPDFWDASTKTIDYSLAGEFLESGILPHGDIDIEILKQWYAGRGREKRFSDSEVRTVFEAVGCRVLKSLALPSAPSTLLYDVAKDE